MCKGIYQTAPCLDYKCQHNLFWEELRLDMNKIRMTEKSFRIKNCCCLIHEPWTSEEIAEAWGLPKRKVEESEKLAKRKVHERDSVRPGGLHERVGYHQR